jgi:hypothetical protein
MGGQCCPLNPGHSTHRKMGIGKWGHTTFLIFGSFLKMVCPRRVVSPSCRRHAQGQSYIAGAHASELNHKSKAVCPQMFSQLGVQAPGVLAGSTVLVDARDAAAQPVGSRSEPTEKRGHTTSLISLCLPVMRLCVPDHVWREGSTIRRRRSVDDRVVQWRTQ